MSELFLNNKVTVFLFSEVVIYILASIAFLTAIVILKKWDFNKFTKEQFNLEKKQYLVSTVIFFILIIKIFTTIYFVYTIDSLAILVPGAMCAAGVISANSYGLNLLFLKLVILFFLIFWSSLNSYDLKAKNYPFLKLKMAVFIVVFSLLTAELVLDFLYFLNIDLNLPVSCCSTLFGQLEGQNPLPFGLNIPKLITLFYILYVIVILSLILNQKVISAISAVLFVVVAYYSVVYFFGTYVYELPTHKCPFCMMQREYYYIGYIIWGSLFLGVYFSIIWAVNAIFFKIDNISFKRWGAVSLTIFVLICSLYVAIYYFRNGVLL